MSIELPAEIRTKLRRASRRATFRAFAEGATWTALVFIATGWIAIALDRAGIVDGLGRHALSAGVLAAVAAVAFRLWAIPSFRRPAAVDVAQAVEAEYPSLGERLLGTVELAASRDPAEIVGSERLVNAAASDAAAASRSLAFERAIRWERAGRLGLALFALSGISLGVIALWPGRAANLWTRHLLFWREVPRWTATRIEVSPGSGPQLLGSAIAIRAATYGDLPSRATLVIETAEEQTRHAMEPVEGEAGVFASKVAVLRSFTYRVRAGDAQSPPYEIEAVPAPEVRSIAASLSPPAYSRRPAEEIENIGSRLEALEGTKAAFRVIPTKEVVSARIIWSEGSAQALAPAADGSLPFSFEFTAGRTFQVELTDSYGFHNAIERSFELRAIPDEAPRVRITRPSGSLEVPRRDAVPYEWEATDDLGISTCELRIQIGDQVRTTALPDPRGEPAAGGRDAIAITDLGLPATGVAQFTFWIAVKDTYPGDPPHWAESERRTVTVRDEGPSLAERAREVLHETFTRSLEDVAKEIAAVRDETRPLEARAGDPAALAQGAPPLEGRLERAAERIEQIAREFESDPMRRPLARPTSLVAAGPVSSARQEISRAGEARAPALAKAALASSRDRLDAALSALDTIRREMDRLREIEAARDQLAGAAQEAARIAELAAQPDANAQALEQGRQRIEATASEVAQELTPLQRAALAEAQEPLAQAAAEADRLARAQQAVAREAAATQERQRIASEMDAIRREQRDIREDATPLGEKAADEPLAGAVQALDAPDIPRALAEQEEARDALRNVADRNPGAGAAPLAELFRELAREQRELRERGAGAAEVPSLPRPNRTNPANVTREALRQAADLARRGNQIRSTPERERLARELAENPAPDLLAKGEFEKAREAQEEALRDLEALGEDLASRGAAEAAAKKDRDEERRRREEENLARQVPQASERMQQGMREAEREGEKQEALDRATAEAKSLAGAESDLRDRAVGAEETARAAGLLPGDRPSEAGDAMAQAQRELEQGRPRNAAEPQQRAEKALENLAQILQTRHGERIGRDLASELARKLDEGVEALREETQSLADERGPGDRPAQPSPEALSRLAREAESLASEAAKAEALAGRREERPSEALREARSALESGQLAGAAQAEEKAAERLDDLREDLEQEIWTEGEPAEASLARELEEIAKEEDGLARETAEASGSAPQTAGGAAESARREALGKLAPSQEALARKASGPEEKAREMLGESGEEGSNVESGTRAMGSAAKALAAGAADEALREERRAAEALRDLADRLRDSAEIAQAEEAGQARTLAGRQEALRQRLEAMAKSQQALAEAAKSGSPSGTSEPSDLAREEAAIGEGARAMGKSLAEMAPRVTPFLPQGTPPMPVEALGRRAPESAQAASKQLEGGDLAGARTPMGSTQRSLDSARDALGAIAKRAAEGAAQPAQGQGQGQPQQGAQGAEAAQAGGEPGQAGTEPGQRQGQGQGQDMQAAAQNMMDAFGALAGAPGQGPPTPGAGNQLGPRMSQASQSLAQAAAALSPTPPGQAGSAQGIGATAIAVAPGVAIDLGVLEKLQASEDWGKLPGNLREDLIQAAKERSPREFAKLIQLYFAEIADRERRKEK